MIGSGGSKRQNHEANEAALRKVSYTYLNLARDNVIELCNIGRVECEQSLAADHAVETQAGAPIRSQIRTEVTRYGNRFWAVYLNGELLAVTVYKKGAVAVQKALNAE
jgi:hypothetical protein